MEIKLQTFDIDIVGDAYIDHDLCDTYPFETKYPTIGIYCLADDAMAIIDELQARIEYLEGELG